MQELTMPKLYWPPTNSNYASDGNFNRMHDLNNNIDACIYGQVGQLIQVQKFN